MSKLDFSVEWQVADTSDPILKYTSAQLKIMFCNTCLTRNIDVWSQTIHDSVYMPVYPLAMRLANSWWRLNYEPLPISGAKSVLDWRMSHEMGAAGQGFVWPTIRLAPDGEQMNIWAKPLSTAGQSINYTTQLNGPGTLPISEFRQSASSFIECVIARLDKSNQQGNELSSLWSLIQEDSESPDVLRIRQLESFLGYDPEECPEKIIEDLLKFQKITGREAMSELAPVFQQNIDKIKDLQDMKGLTGFPRIPSSDIDMLSLKTQGPPWKQGKTAAENLRKQIDMKTDCVLDDQLYELLGLSEHEVENGATRTDDVAVGKPDDSGKWTWITRKNHPVSRRFELARFIGNLSLSQTHPAGWLVSSDLATANQKKQRSFAAEFLCPIENLIDFLGGNYSESTREKAADHFQVSEMTVETLLINHGYIEHHDSGFLY